MAEPAALKRRRDYAGPALFSYGFRPFFLAAATWAAAAIVLWLPVYFGEVELPTHFGALDWHVHEMIYGYVAAAMTGFLLTAIPNWTGRLPINGLPLAALALLWLAGRAAVIVSAWIGPVAAAVIDISFLAVLMLLAGREIVAGKNWRNLRVLIVVGALVTGNVVFHLEVLLHGAADYGIRIAIAAVIVLISVIGGRIVPSFTNNWLSRHNPGRMPTRFSWFDGLCIGVGAVALLAWIAAPAQSWTGISMLVAGALHLVRLLRWAGDRAARDLLVLVLHVAYAFVSAGFLLLGASVVGDAVPASAGIHAWTAGAVGMMTLAVMTRASLGHTGQPLVASVATQLIYASALVAALLRIAATFSDGVLLLHLSAAAWIAAFGGFMIVYGPLLVMRPPAWSRARD